MSAKPRVTLKFIRSSGYMDYEAIEVRLDDKVIATGNYGGEPEDNCRYRDYSWVETALTAVAESLGADVAVEEMEEE